MTCFIVSAEYYKEGMWRIIDEDLNESDNMPELRDFMNPSVPSWFLSVLGLDKYIDNGLPELPSDEVAKILDKGFDIQSASIDGLLSIKNAITKEYYHPVHSHHFESIDGIIDTWAGNEHSEEATKIFKDLLANKNTTLESLIAKGFTSSNTEEDYESLPTIIEDLNLLIYTAIAKIKEIEKNDENRDGCPIRFIFSRG